MKTGSDFESSIARLARIAGVAAIVAAQPSRDAKLIALAQAFGGLAGATHDAQIADAEARTRAGAAVTRRPARSPGRSRPARKKAPRRK